MWRYLRIGCALVCAAQGVMLLGGATPAQARAAGAVIQPCTGLHLDVSPALTDLGADRYVRMDGTATAFTGGLYPNGSNDLPATHQVDGLARAAQVIPLDANGRPNTADGRIVLLAIGMSNTALEFREFRNRLRADPAVNPRLVAVSGAAAGQVAEHWLDPQGPNWQHIGYRLAHANVTPAQVQVVWLKLTRTGGGEFPEKAQQLQDDLGNIARNLLENYPNLKLIYLSSRTRAYQYWHGLSPEPAAFETGFAVKWLIEQQIAGDAALNFDAGRGPVLAPWLAWGPYLWIDGLNSRSDGTVWSQENLERDCTHPSAHGIDQVAGMMLEFFTADVTAQPWFLADPPPAGAGSQAVPATATPWPEIGGTKNHTPCSKVLRQCVR